MTALASAAGSRPPERGAVTFLTLRPSEAPIQIAVLITSYERREVTLGCLSALASQRTSHDIRIVLVDASSRDGTAAAVRDRWPDVRVEVVADDVFWNRGMRRAWQVAMDDGADAYLWLNDDTTLDADAVDRLAATWSAAAGRGQPATVVVGTTRDPETGAPTYGGVRRPSPWRPLRYEMVPPTDGPVPAETMNGNCVLVPAAVVDRVGILDPAYVHGMGDFDYGHRARAAGCAVLVAPGTVGTCPRNPTSPPAGSVTEEWRRLRRPTALPPADFARFARRWGGPLWPVYWASPYVRRLARAWRH